MFSRENVSFPLFCLTVRVLPRRAAPGSEGLLRPAVLLIEAPALGDLVGTGLSPILCPGRLDFPSGDGSFGRTGEHLVLQAGLPTAESGQGERGFNPFNGRQQRPASVHESLASYGCVLCEICESWHWRGFRILPQRQHTNGQCPTAEGAMSTYQHSGAFSGSGKQQEATSKHARGEQSDSEPWSHSEAK